MSEKIFQPKVIKAVWDTLREYAKSKGFRTDKALELILDEAVSRDVLQARIEAFKSSPTQEPAQPAHNLAEDMSNDPEESHNVR